jgi:hypothetical protein
MSLLSSTDQALQRYRNQVFKLMKRYATDCTMVWYDASPLQRQHHPYLPDGMHINRPGHDFLRMEIGKNLTGMVAGEVKRGMAIYTASWEITQCQRRTFLTVCEPRLR